MLIVLRNAEGSTVLRDLAAVSAFRNPLVSHQAQVAGVPVLVVCGHD